MSSKDYRTERKVIDHVERRDSSVNGNPAWLVYFTDGTSARTMSDTMWSYEAENRDNRGVPLDVVFTPGGRIRYATKVQDA